MADEVEFDEAELTASLGRAFVGHLEETILFDGQVSRNRFLVAGIGFGVERGWLEVAGGVDQDQYTAVYYGLTSEGKEYFSGCVSQ